MMKFPGTFDDESLLTYEVSDEALETAGGKEIAVNFTLGSCTGLSECPRSTGTAQLQRLEVPRVKQHPELDRPGRYRRPDR